MKWALMVKRGKRKGMIIPVHQSPFLIGRSDECQLRPASPHVGDRHCELLIEGDKFVVRDCNSPNGTFINYQRIQGQVELHEGDHVKVGALAFIVCLEDFRPIEKRHIEPATPNFTRPKEHTLEDILLNLDEEAAGIGPGAWKNTGDENEGSQPGYITGRKPEKSEADNAPKPSPSDVARALLKGHSLLKRQAKNPFRPLNS